MSKSYSNCSAYELAEMVRSGETTPLALIDAAQAAAELVNPHINALTQTNWDGARALVTADVPRGPFAGVPILIKETAAEQGKQWTFGSRGCARNVAPMTDVYVKRLLALGFVPVGRTNVPELGLMDVTESILFGPARNPWNTGHTPGGSSGGASAAVAAGIVPFAHGNDGGGSLRAPASHTGLFTIKPTRRRLNVPYLGTGAPAWLPELVGTLGLSRYVRDIATVLEHIEPDPTSGLTFDRIVHAPLTRTEDTRIAINLTGLNGEVPDPEVAKAVTVMAEVCRDLGFQVQVVDWPFSAPKFHEAFFDMWQLRTVETITEYEALTGRPAGPQDLEPFTFGLAEGARRLPGAVEQTIREVFASTFAGMNDFFGRFDVLLTPVTASPPIKIGDHDPSLPFETVFSRVRRNVVYTPLGNAYGNPSMSVPAGLTPDGLPVGAMFSAAPGRDGLLIRLAYALEHAAAWAHLRPPVFANV